MLLSMAMAFSAELKKVAILETVDQEEKLSYGQKLLLRTTLAKAVAGTKGYEAYDRTDIDAILGEQNFQRTGFVSEKEIRNLGEMAGVSFILIPEAVLMDDNQLFVTAKILNVETAKVERSDNMMMGLSSKEMEKGCKKLASKLFKAETQADAVEIIQTIAFPYGALIKKSKEKNKAENTKQ